MRCLLTPSTSATSQVPTTSSGLSVYVMFTNYTHVVRWSTLVTPMVYPTIVVQVTCHSDVTAWLEQYR
jgi:hypothetical protein